MVYDKDDNQDCFHTFSFKNGADTQVSKSNNMIRSASPIYILNKAENLVKIKLIIIHYP